MALIQRQTGTVSSKIRIFVNDATVSTGAGLANIVASSVSFGWSRDNMSAVSTGTCTTGTLGTYGVSSFVQASSTGALGWYEFSPPDGVFLSGSSCILHFSGAPSMAPVPILIELTKTDNQTFMSSQTISTTLNSLGLVGSVNASTVSVGVNASSVTGAVNVTSFNGAATITTAAGVISTDSRTVLGSAWVTTAAGVVASAFDLGRTANLTSTIALTGTSLNFVTTVANLTGGVNMTSVVGSAAVTSSAGIQAYTFDLGRTANGNSTVAFSSLSISSQSVTVGGVNVTSVMGSSPVTSSAGVLSVTGSVNVTSIVGTAAVTSSAGLLAFTFDLSRTANNNSTVAFSSVSFSSQAVTVGSVDVSSFAGTAIVTSSAGILNVSTQTIDKTGYSLTAAEEAAIADALLGRNVAGGSSAGRLVSEALYVLRNKVDISAGIVYQTDDVTSSWAFTSSTQAGNPLVSIDPA